MEVVNSGLQIMDSAWEGFLVSRNRPQCTKVIVDDDNDEPRKRVIRRMDTIGPVMKDALREWKVHNPACMVKVPMAKYSTIEVACP